MFTRVVVRGSSGAILWGYRAAADVRGWTISHHRPDAQHAGDWILEARLARTERFMLRQTPLLFSAPRPGGFWAFPLIPDSLQTDHVRLIAKLGAIEKGTLA